MNNTALILANTGLGDHIALTIPLAREVSKTNQVNCLTHSLHGCKLLRHAVPLASCIHTDNLKMEYIVD